MYKNTCVTGRKRYAKNQVNKCISYPIMTHPFDNLVIKPDKGSLGKCWVFHLNCRGELKGLLLPSNLRIFEIFNTDYCGE